MKKVFLFLVLSLICEKSSATLVQWSAVNGGNGHYYEVVLVPERISWTNAKTNAELKGGYLATITSVEENVFVFSLVTIPACWTVGTPGTSLGPWLGGFQSTGSPEPAGNWQWVTGEPFTYSCWAPFEPSNGWGLEHFLSFYNGTANSMASTWNDLQNYDASYAPVAYIIEYIPEPCTVLLLGLGGLMIRKR
jgi:hypothetical protein